MCSDGRLEKRMWRKNLPSSRTSTTAILLAGVLSSRLLDGCVCPRSILERSVAESRGSVATVWDAILRINGVLMAKVVEA